MPVQPPETRYEALGAKKQPSGISEVAVRVTNFFSIDTRKKWVACRVRRAIPIDIMFAEFGGKFQ